MKSKLVVKIVIDIILMGLFTFLTFGYNMSALFHEISGITIFVLFIIHFILNISLIRQLFKSKKLKSKFLLICDIFLTLGVIILAVTAIVISKFLFPNNLIENYSLFSSIHSITSYICLGIMGVHLLFHAKYFVLAIKAIIKNIKKAAVLRVLASSAAIITTFAFLYVLISPVYTPDEPYFKSSEQIETVIPSTPSNSDNQTVNKSEDEQKTEEDDKKTVQSSGSGDNQSATVTLKEFLSKMFCTGCSKHCPLSAPQCSKGVAKAEQAETQYYAEYGDQ